MIKIPNRFGLKVDLSIAALPIDSLPRSGLEGSSIGSFFQICCLLLTARARVRYYVGILSGWTDYQALDGSAYSSPILNLLDPTHTPDSHQGLVRLAV